MINGNLGPILHRLATIARMAFKVIQGRCFLFHLTGCMLLPVGD